MSFPGTTDYILTTDSADFEFGGSTDFTIEAYVNPTGAPGQQDIIVFLQRVRVYNFTTCLLVP